MATTTESSLEKQCRVKTAVVQRIQKELQRYHEDLDAQKAKVARMRQDNGDEYDIKKQVEVQAETEVMVPDTMRRLDKAVEDLQEFVSGNELELQGTAQLDAAKAILGNSAAPVEIDDDERI